MKCELTVDVVAGPTVVTGAGAGEVPVAAVPWVDGVVYGHVGVGWLPVLPRGEIGARFGVVGFGPPVGDCPPEAAWLGRHLAGKGQGLAVRHGEKLGHWGLSNTIPGAREKTHMLEQLQITDHKPSERTASLVFGSFKVTIQVKHVKSLTVELREIK